MSGRHSKDFFPYVGIQPANDGGLFAAGLFATVKHTLQQEENPRSFLETIAVTNWCKFSIQAKTNKDYIGNAEKLAISLPFVKKELALLQPKIVLLPKVVYSIFQVSMEKASLQSIFLPAPQFNSTVVNCHLGEYDRLASQLKNKLANTPLASWMENVRRVSKKHAWRYIAMLDGIATQK
jgi:hypothetical protein